MFDLAVIEHFVSV